jgi:hypothetical protein
MTRSLRRLVPKRIRGSFGAKLAVALAIVVLVVATFGGYIYFHTGTTLRNDTQRQLVTNSEIQADNLNEWMNRMTVQMESVSESAAFQSDDQSEITVQLWDIVNRDGQIEAAYYIDTRSNSVITSTGSTRVVSAEGVLKRSGQHRLTSVEVDFSEDVFVSKPFRSYDGGAPILLFVTGVSESRYAVGYFGYAYYAQNEDSVTALAIDGGDGCVLPSLESAKSGTYSPLSRPLFIYAAKESLRKPECREFCRYYLEEVTMNLVRQIGYLPITDAKSNANRKRFEETLAAL